MRQNRKQKEKTENDMRSRDMKTKRKQEGIQKKILSTTV